MLPSFAKPSCAKILHKIVFAHLSNATRQRYLNISCQVEQLPSRGLIRVSGDDVIPFLQGIVTNDLKHLQENSKSLFAMFLNTKGRVLYDSIIYKTNSENKFFVECDREGIQDLVRHIKMYRVRRKIDIDSVADEWKLWAMFNPTELENSSSNVKNVKQEQVVPCTYPDEKGNTYFNDIVLSDNASVYSDPRLSYLGSRVIAPSNENVVKCLKEAGVQVVASSPWSYRMFRYRLGVGEGIIELPIGKCFPLEVNCDYLHGVSFHKGCYIGQELTARTHHTGVVRKRLMPLILSSEVAAGDLPVDTAIEVVAGEKRTPIGKLKGVEKNTALGLMRIAEALEANTFKIGSTEGETVRPFWWPLDLPKERLDSGSSRRS